MSQQTPPEGWVPLIQNAIMNLDRRIENMGEVVQHHQGHFDDMMKEHEDLVNIALSTDKEDTN